ncbi:hypothetical protein DIPPA_11211 [Diplonema papillatum]|nr:hypothetical protein DIPPA_11211 [Diplonema papillatum]
MVWIGFELLSECRLHTQSYEAAGDCEVWTIPKDPLLHLLTTPSSSTNAHTYPLALEAASLALHSRLSPATPHQLASASAVAKAQGVPFDSAACRAAFKSLAPKQWQAAVPALAAVVYSAGTCVCRLGVASDCFAVLTHGVVVAYDSKNQPSPAIHTPQFLNTADVLLARPAEYSVIVRSKYAVATLIPRSLLLAKFESHYKSAVDVAVRCVLGLTAAESVQKATTGAVKAAAHQAADDADPSKLGPQHPPPQARAPGRGRDRRSQPQRDGGPTGQHAAAEAEISGETPSGGKDDRIRSPALRRGSRLRVATGDAASGKPQADAAGGCFQPAPDAGDATPASDTLSHRESDNRGPAPQRVASDLWVGSVPGGSEGSLRSPGVVRGKAKAPPAVDDGGSSSSGSSGSRGAPPGKETAEGFPPAGGRGAVAQGAAAAWQKELSFEPGRGDNPKRICTVAKKRRRGRRSPAKEDTFTSPTPPGGCKDHPQQASSRGGETPVAQHRDHRRQTMARMKAQRTHRKDNLRQMEAETPAAHNAPSQRPPQPGGPTDTAAANAAPPPPRASAGDRSLAGFCRSLLLRGRSERGALLGARDGFPLRPLFDPPAKPAGFGRGRYLGVAPDADLLARGLPPPVFSLAAVSVQGILGGQALSFPRPCPVRGQTADGSKAPGNSAPRDASGAAAAAAAAAANSGSTPEGASDDECATTHASNARRPLPSVRGPTADGSKAPGNSAPPEASGAATANCAASDDGRATAHHHPSNACRPCRPLPAAAGCHTPAASERTAGLTWRLPLPAEASPVLETAPRQGQRSKDCAPSRKRGTGGTARPLSAASNGTEVTGGAIGAPPRKQSKAGKAGQFEADVRLRSRDASSVAPPLPAADNVPEVTVNAVRTSSDGQSEADTQLRRSDAGSTPPTQLANSDTEVRTSSDGQSEADAELQRGDAGADNDTEVTVNAVTSEEQSDADTQLRRSDAGSTPPPQLGDTVARSMDDSVTEVTANPAETPSQGPSEADTQRRSDAGSTPPPQPGRTATGSMDAAAEVPANAAGTPPRGQSEADTQLRRRNVAPRRKPPSRLEVEPPTPRATLHSNLQCLPGMDSFRSAPPSSPYEGTGVTGSRVIPSCSPTTKPPGDAVPKKRRPNLNSRRAVPRPAGVATPQVHTSRGIESCPQFSGRRAGSGLPDLSACRVVLGAPEKERDTFSTRNSMRGGVDSARGSEGCPVLPSSPPDAEQVCMGLGHTAELPVELPMLAGVFSHHRLDRHRAAVRKRKLGSDTLVIVRKDPKPPKRNLQLWKALTGSSPAPREQQAAHPASLECCTPAPFPPVLSLHRDCEPSRLPGFEAARGFRI